MQRAHTHVHMHLNKDERSRLAEEKDLLAHYTNALEPHGRNVSSRLVNFEAMER